MKLTITMNRSLIYPHRSMRVVPVSVARLAVAALVAASLSLVTLALLNPLLQAHEFACVSILNLTQIPVVEWRQVKVLPAFRSVAVPVVEVPALTASSKSVMLAGGCVFGVLLVLHRRYPLGRSFVFFIMALILTSLGVMVLNSRLSISSTDFTQLWLRTQTVLWCLLPWLGAFLILPMEPSLPHGIGWIVTMALYGILWSAVRLAFSLGVLHYTGILFATTLWFALGPLADLLYILVFYSFAVHRASKRRWGTRLCVS